MTSDYKPEVNIELGMRSEKSPNCAKSCIERLKFSRHEGNRELPNLFRVMNL